jgi:2'-5' RNA ligase
MAPRVEAASLWLMPEGAVADRLSVWIDRLARSLRTERFAPHVTLLSGLSGEALDLVAATRRAAERLAPVHVHLSAIEGRDEHFRCLFVRAVEPAALGAAHATVAGVFGRAADPAFLPHLSLVYGSLPVDRKEDLARDAGPGIDVRFEARSLRLWSTAGPVASWRELAAFDLGRP